jgi:outer membrane protein assembly factor BamB
MKRSSSSKPTRSRTAGLDGGPSGDDSFPYEDQGLKNGLEAILNGPSAGLQRGSSGYQPSRRFTREERVKTLEETPAPASVTENRPPEPQRRSRIARIATRALVVMLSLFLLSQPLIWLAWRPAMGDSLKNLITYSQAMLSTLCVIGWWFCCAPVSRPTRLKVGVPIVVILAIWVGSIRRVEFSGDMVPHLTYRWQPSTAERLQAFQNRKKPWWSEIPPPSMGSFEIEAEDSPAYRGIHRDGVVIGPALMQDWSQAASREKWRAPCGGGYSSFSILGPQAVTMEQRGPDEAIVCYETGSGRQLWEHRYPAAFDEALGGPGPRSTPTISGDAVYSFGAFGDLCCLGLEDGKLRWHVNSLEQFQTPNTIWAMSGSPLVDDGKVIVNIGGLKGNGLIAYRVTDGSVVWHGAGLPEPRSIQKFQTGEPAVSAAGTSVPGYSSPMLANLKGFEQILILDGTALRGIDRESGAELWSFPFEAGDHVSVAQPIVFPDGRVFLAASYGKGNVMVQIERRGESWETSELWTGRTMRCKFTSPVLWENYLYGLDEGLMVCVDPQTGSRMWKGGKTGLRGRYGHGQILLTNGQIVVLTESGEAVLVQASPEALQELTSLRVLPEGKTWNPPTLARGRLFVRNASEMACYDLNLPPATASAIAD